MNFQVDVRVKTIQNLIVLTLLILVPSRPFWNIVDAEEPISGRTTKVQIDPADSVLGPIDLVELENFLDAYFAEQMETHHIPGLVFTLVRTKEVFFSKGYGYADIEDQIPFNPDETVLTAASLAKAFTAVGVLQLYEQGLIDLNEDIRPYFNKFQLDTRYSKPLTFANLLTHTDGFESRLIGVAGQVEADLLPLGALLEANRPVQIYPPGEHMTYSDYGANLAGYLIQEISGVPYAQYMADNIFAPLGMTDSTLDLRTPEDLFVRLATGYEYQDGRQKRLPPIGPSYAPSGGLRTTAADINRFMLALLSGGECQDGHILDQASTLLMFTRQFSSHPRLGGITYGFFEHLENGQQVFLRDGDGVGTRSRMVLIPEQDLGFFISYNSDDSNLRLDIINAIFDFFFPVDGTHTSAPLAVSSEHSAPVTGSYRILQADTTTFGKSIFFFAQLIKVHTSKDGNLIIEPTSGGDSFGGFEGSSQWVAIEPLYYERVDGKGQITFTQEKGGGITHLISGQGYHGTYVKLPWYETQSFHIILLVTVILLLIPMVIYTFIFWPLGVLIHKLRLKSKQNTSPQGAIIAWFWAAFTSGMFLVLTSWVIYVLYVLDAIAGVPNFVWGISDDMAIALNSMYLPAVLAAALPFFTILAWIEGWWKIPIRVYYTLLTLAVFAGLWWAHYWNLLGFRF